MKTKDTKDKVKKEYLHKDHKVRLRQKFLEEGDFDGFYDHEILEMLLSYSVVRGDTNATAHRLIDKFNTLSGVLEASPEALMSVDGVAERSAALIKMQYQLFRAYLVSKYKVKNKQCDTSEIIEHLKGLFFGKKQEFLYMVCVDDKNKVIKVKFMGYGITDLSIDHRAMLREILNLDARGIILAHNHPNGICVPSQEDIDSTKSLESYLKAIDVRLIDHFIFTDDDWESVLNHHSFKVKNFNNGVK